MSLFRNKYKVESARLPEWDYSTNGVYFITICTHLKEHLFGEIKDNQMSVSPIGLIAKQFLTDIPKHFDHVKLHAHIVMPNHIHVLIVTNKPTITIFENSQKGAQDEDIFIDVCETLQCNVSTDNTNEYMSEISPEKGSISTIIRSYKSAVTREARKINPDFAWQERFHDHIIRNKITYYKIKQYILDNPKNWQNDMFY